MSIPTVGQASSLPGDSGRQDACPTWLRRALYCLFIVIAASLVTARTMRVRSPDAFSPTPFQSANDKSRWCTIRALGDHGVYSIEHIIFYSDDSQVRGWHTIDLVRHRGPDGREHYYSSKPTLLTTLLAGEYWLVKQATGLSLSAPDQVWVVTRLMLVLTNVVPLVIALCLLARMIDSLGQSDWGRLFTFVAAALATFVTTYSVTLNNHSIAACTLVFALAATIPIWQERGQWWHFALAGLLFSFTAASELPAVAMLALAAAGLAWKSPLKTALYFAPPALLVLAAALGTNYYAHGDWRPPYAHRQDGPAIGMLKDALAVPPNDNRVTDELRSALAEAGIELSADATVITKSRGDRWELFDPQSHHRYALQRTPEGAESLGIEIRQWDNWYDYPGTHWDRRTVTGLDRGEPSPLVYTFHCLVGHHGLFSLTPLWLLSIAGCWLWLGFAKPRPLVGVMSESSPTSTLTTGQGFEKTTRTLALAAIFITAVVLAFYLTRPLADRNYGGGTCCLRWLIWITPLWLLTLLPAADWLGKSRAGRIIALTLLAISVFSAHYAADNPWAHPWIFTLGEWLGWWKYR
ncbi:MAG: hypothetical protein L0211_20700 [Planctomycetaceae bacterium]|nr:hypothetical protein [Planctomycetaceae bacterium]